MSQLPAVASGKSLSDDIVYLVFTVCVAYAYNHETEIVFEALGITVISNHTK